LGRIVTQIAYSGNALYAVTQRTYDGLGRLLTLRQNGVLLRTLAYDSLGRKTQMADQDSGTWRYGYDGVGNLLWQDDPRPSRHVEFCYDAINRPTRRCSFATDFQTPAACGVQSACTDPEAIISRYDEAQVPYSKGRLTSVDDASGTTEIGEYDAHGRQHKLTTTIDLADGSRHARFELAYDTNDRVVSTKYPDGEIRADGVRRRRAADRAAQPEQQLLRHRCTLRRLRSPDACRPRQRCGRHTRLRRSLQRAPPPRTDGSQGTDETPRPGVRRIHRSRPACAGHRPAQCERRAHQHRCLHYDALGRLTGFDSSYGPLDAVFAYDAMGNLTRRGDRYLRYDNAAKPHQATSLRVGSPTAQAIPVTHDANGNRVGKGSQQYDYDAGDRLDEVAVGSDRVRFVYDFRGRQAAKIVTTATSSSTTRFYSALAETTGGSLTKWYFLGTAACGVADDHLRRLETAALDGSPVWLATASLEHPALIVVLAREARWAAGTVVLCIAVGLLAAPWRRRPVVGIAVRPGHAIFVALLCATGSLPWPIAFQPPPAVALGGGGAIVRHYHLDHLGATQVVTDSVGAIVEQVRYLPYGTVRGHWDRNNVLIANPGDGNRREFGGYISEPLSGLQYAGARFYDPDLGSFLTHDPATQFASPYSYGGGDPVELDRPDRRGVLHRVLARPRHRRQCLGGDQCHHRRRARPAAQRHRQGRHQRRHRRRRRRRLGSSGERRSDGRGQLGGNTAGHARRSHARTWQGRRSRSL
jgi:RHS repeat-associated protein